MASGDRQASAQRWVKEYQPMRRRHPVGGPRVGFTVLPKGWVIERTIAWILRNWRMSRDYELDLALAQTTEALVYVAMIWLMLRRLAKGVS